MDILIIGAGVIGVNTAHALLDEGHTVTLLDPDGGANRATGAPSAGNAGWIATADILPLASPKSLRNLPSMLSDPLGPLSIRPAYLPTVAPWLLRFLWASRPSALEASTRALTELQIRALPAWLERVNALGLKHHIHRRGGLYVFDTQGKLDEAKSYAQRQQANGIAIDIITPDEARQLEPALKAGFAGAAYHTDGAHISDPLRLTSVLKDAAIARGAKVITGKASALEAGEKPAAITSAGRIEADAIVLSAGIWSKPLAATIGDRVPLDTERGYNVSFGGLTGLLSRPVAFEGHGFVVTPLDTGLRVGGAVEFAGLEAAPNHDRTRALHTKAQRFLDGVPDFEKGETWMGFRPSLPDSLPVIGRSSRSPRIIHAFGHGHLGMTQSALTGRMVADMLAGRDCGFDAGAFSVGRF
jgi:D-amino-acid dehydrogenase